MLPCALMGAPKYADRYVVTPTLAASCTLVHPCPGSASWFMTDPSAGSITGSVFTPAGGFYGIGHIVGKVGNVRGLLNVWVVPTNTPRYTTFLPHVTLYKTEQDFRTQRGIHPRPGAWRWTEWLAQTTLGWDTTLWNAPVLKTITVTPNFGTNELTGSVTGGAVPHSWFVLERVPGTQHYLDRTSVATLVSGGTADTAVFSLPLLTANHTLLATDQWDCWLMPAPA